MHDSVVTDGTSYYLTPKGYQILSGGANARACGYVIEGTHQTLVCSDVAWGWLREDNPIKADLIQSSGYTLDTYLERVAYLSNGNIPVRVIRPLSHGDILS